MQMFRKIYTEWLKKNSYNRACSQNEYFTFHIKTHFDLTFNGTEFTQFNKKINWLLEP